MAEKISFGKTCQISVPSDPQIKQTLRDITDQIRARRTFMGKQVDMQDVVNSIVVALADLGPQTWDYLFDHGASILIPAMQAGEPGIPLGAGRPLRKQFKWLSDGEVVESDAPPIPKPLPSVRLPNNKLDDRRRGKGKR